jgi:hypothetical protein
MKNSEKNIVITTINDTSEALTAFDKMDGWRMIIIGDRKGPSRNPCENAKFYSIDDQLLLDCSFAQICPVDHYSRKNIGYLLCFERGCSIIYETDDDNIPLENWGEFPQFDGVVKVINSKASFFNIYSLYTDQKVWPRGYPLDEILEDHKCTIVDKQANIGVWQGLANIDPDVDAIYRLTCGDDVKFGDGNYALGEYLFCPFNSQNTLWSPLSYMFMYLPCTVSFRFTDILRGYVAQRMLWKNEMTLGFNSPTVQQLRNEHNLMTDFSDEITMYTQTKKVVQLLSNIEIDELTDADAMRLIYKCFSDEEIVEADELKYLEAWLSDCETLLNNK